MRFSVVIPVLNTPSLGTTLDALTRQEFDCSDYEVIVVGMDRWGLVRPGSSVRFERSPVPLFPGVARNHGVAVAAGDVVAFTDADCIPSPGWLKTFAQWFAKSEVAVVGGGVAFASNNYWTLADNISIFHDYLVTSPAGTRSLLASLNLAVRRNVFLEVGGFDETRPAGEDSDLSIRLRQRGHTLHFDPRAYVEHRPARHHFSDLVRHGYYLGGHSIKVDPRYRHISGLPRVLRTRWGVLLASPAIAAMVSLRIFFQNRSLWRHVITFPAIFCSKLAWCVGAANRPQRRMDP